MGLGVEDVLLTLAVDLDVVLRLLLLLLFDYLFEVLFLLRAGYQLDDLGSLCDLVLLSALFFIYFVESHEVEWLFVSFNVDLEGI